MGYLTLADFELAHVIEMFDWICSKTGVKSPFIHFPKLVALIDRVKSLNGVRDFCLTPKESLPFFFKGMAQFH